MFKTWYFKIRWPLLNFLLLMSKTSVVNNHNYIIVLLISVFFKVEHFNLPHFLHEQESNSLRWSSVCVWARVRSQDAFLEK